MIDFYFDTEFAEDFKKPIISTYTLGEKFGNLLKKNG